MHVAVSRFRIARHAQKWVQNHNAARTFLAFKYNSKCKTFHLNVACSNRPIIQFWQISSRLSGVGSMNTMYLAHDWQVRISFKILIQACSTDLPKCLCLVRHFPQALSIAFQAGLSERILSHLSPCGCCCPWQSASGAQGLLALEKALLSPQHQLTSSLAFCRQERVVF